MAEFLTVEDLHTRHLVVEQKDWPLLLNKLFAVVDGRQVRKSKKLFKHCQEDIHIYLLLNYMISTNTIFTNWIPWHTSLKCLRTPNIHIHVRSDPRVSKIIPGLTKSPIIQGTNYDEKIFLILLETLMCSESQPNTLTEKCIYRITEKILTSNKQIIPAHRKPSMEWSKSVFSRRFRL